MIYKVLIKNNILIIIIMWMIIMNIRNRIRRRQREFEDPIDEELQEIMDLGELEELYKMYGMIEVFLKKRTRILNTDIKKGCCICLCDIKKKTNHITLRCGHHYHHKCIRNWIRTKPNCPLCRADCYITRRICWN